MEKENRFVIKSFGDATPLFGHVPEAPKPSPELDKVTQIFVEEMKIKTAGKTVEEIEDEIKSHDQQWIDEINNMLGLPIDEEHIKALWKKGYNFVDLFYLSTYGITYLELRKMTPAEVSEMADQFAQTDDKLLGC